MPRGVYARPSVDSRFWAKVNKNGPIAPSMDTPCWLWTATPVSHYGQFWDGNRHVRAHRWSWEQEHGPVPPGLELDHKCRTRLCVRPSHMEPVTSCENQRRRRHPSKTAELVELGRIYRLFRRLRTVEHRKHAA